MKSCIFLEEIMRVRIKKKCRKQHIRKFDILKNRANFEVKEEIQDISEETEYDNMIESGIDPSYSTDQKDQSTNCQFQRKKTNPIR